MSTIVAAAGGGNWTVGATWIGGVAPSAADDAQLTVASGNVTIDTGAVARSLDCTGYTGTLTHTAGINLNLGDATAGAGNVALKLVPGMTYALGSILSGIQFISTSATQQTITTGGKTLGNWAVFGTGSSFILGDANTVSATATFFLTAGTFNTGNFACSWGLFVINGAIAKTLTLGSSAIAVTGSNGSAAINFTGSNLTITANTAVITMSGAGAGITSTSNWNGASVVFASTVTAAALINGPTFNNVTYTNGANKTSVLQFNGNPTVTGTLTLTGQSAINRIFVNSSTTGTARTVTTAAVALSNVDFQDITAAGAAGTWTGTSMGNALGNTNITFDAPVTQTRTGAGGNYSSLPEWTSRVPLPQDNVIIGAAASGTITMDMPRMGADVTFTGFAGTAAFNSTANTMYGSLVLGAGMTVSGTQGLTLARRTAGGTITSNSKAFTQTVVMAAPGGTYTLTDAFSGLILTLNGVTFTTASFPVTASFVSSSSGTNVLNAGTTSFTLTGTSGTVWDLGTLTTYNTSAATFIFSVASASARTFSGRNATFGTLTYNVAGSTGSLTITGANTFNTINFSDATNGRSLLFTPATTTTVTSFNVFGGPGRLVVIDSVGGVATHTLLKVP